METGYRLLRTKEVVNVNDGGRMGKVCDVIFTYPDGQVMGIVVPGTRWFWQKREPQFIDLRSIVKIGEDVILVEVKVRPLPKEQGKGGGFFDKFDKSPDRSDKKEPTCPPAPKSARRSYDEYE